MFSNYLKTARRSLLRNRGFAVINALGLSVGIASCLLIFLIVRFESSFDTFQSKKERIYRVVTVLNSGDQTRYTAGVPFPVPDGLRQEVPQLEKVADVFGQGDVQITARSGSGTEKKFKEGLGVFFAEPQIFGILDVQPIAGDPASALASPANAVLSREAAVKYFGDWRQAIGKTIVYENRDRFVVSSIIEDNPVNSDFPFKVLLSFASLKSRRADKFEDWVSTEGDNYCFALLSPQGTVGDLNSLLLDFNRRHKPPEYVRDFLIAQPLMDMHYDARFGTFSDQTFSRELIVALALIGMFLLIAACVNFVNLSTAQAANRSHEMGVRKVLGGDRRHLMAHCLAETAIIAALALLAAVVLASALLPFVNRLLDVSLSLNLLADPVILVFLAVVYVAVTLLSGTYPAMVLSGFNPVTALKGRVSSRAVGGVSLRRGLVILQFVISQALIIGMLVVVEQMNFFRNASLGFDKDTVLLLPMPNDSLSLAGTDALRQRLLGQSGVTAVSFSMHSPSDDSHWTSDFMFDQSSTRTKFNADLKWADADFFKTYKFQIVAGRPYSQSDTVRELVVNETLVRKLGIQNDQQILGKHLRFWDGRISAPIVGVVKDFHGSPLRKPMAATVMGCWKSMYRLINIRIQPTHPSATLAAIERIWNDTFPASVYEYQFLDEKIDQFYKGEIQLSEIYQVFAAIAIFISCLGLYGLVSFMAVQRAREVGVRKVLGASVGSVVVLLSKEFTMLIGIAFVVAAPAAYVVMSAWLQDFAFRIQLGVGLFIFAMLGTLTIAWLTVGYRAIKTALANPIEALRHE